MALMIQSILKYLREHESDVYLAYPDNDFKLKKIIDCKAFIEVSPLLSAFYTPFRKSY